MNKTIKVSLNIILIFGIAILMSIIPDLIPNLFGDWKCNGTLHYNVNSKLGECMHLNSPHESMWHWGYRHILWFSMGFCLAIIQIFNIIKFIII